MKITGVLSDGQEATKTPTEGLGGFPVVSCRFIELISLVKDPSELFGCLLARCQVRVVRVRANHLRTDDALVSATLHLPKVHPIHKASCPQL